MTHLSVSVMWAAVIKYKMADLIHIFIILFIYYIIIS